jgi:hypothetical protein
MGRIGFGDKDNGARTQNRRAAPEHARQDDAITSPLSSLVRC